MKRLVVRGQSLQITQKVLVGFPCFIREHERGLGLFPTSTERIGKLLTDRHLAAVVLLGLPAQVRFAFHFERVPNKVGIFGVRKLAVTESAVKIKIKQESPFGISMSRGSRVPHPNER